MLPTYGTVYNRQLEQSFEYQDFIAHRLYAHGIVIVNHQSKQFQIDHGENGLGLEIKYDDWLLRTGNLWIEVAEKTHPDQPRWIPSGIARGDMWLFGIGNYEEFWIFSTKALQRYRARRQPTLRENGTQTSQGFLLPRVMAHHLAERYFGSPPQPAPGS